MKQITRERIWPYMFAAALTAAWLFLGAPFPVEWDGLLTAGVTVASVLGGFLGVSKTILLSMKNSRIFVQLKEAGYTDVFFDYVREGVYASLALVVFSLAGFFVDQSRAVSDQVTHGDIFAALWIFAGLLALFTHIRVSNLLFKLLKKA